MSELYGSDAPAKAVGSDITLHTVGNQVGRVAVRWKHGCEEGELLPVPELWG